jgi:uncharacterized cupin superfamily protein
VEIHKEKLTEEEARSRGIHEWSIWEKEPSEFDWAYTEEEHCYVVEGRAVISHGGGEITVEKGDYAVFPAGMKCRWKVTDGLKKHYRFGR